MLQAVRIGIFGMQLYFDRCLQRVEALLDVLKLVKGENIAGDIPMLSLVVGFVAAFLSGCLACKWMINIVKKGKLIYFAIYCAIVGLITIACTLMK